MKFKNTLLATIAAFGFAGAAQASVVSASGDGLIIAAPAFVGQSTLPSDTTIHAFNEKQNVLLAADLATSTGNIASGMKIASHLVFFNPERPETLPALHPEAEFTFSQKIIGLIYSRNGLVSTTALLGAVGSTYDLDFEHVGIENSDFISFANNGLTLKLKINQPGDWVRVITAVPVPAAGLLLPAGLALFGFGARRRRNKKA